MRLRLTLFLWRSDWVGKALLALCAAVCLSAGALAQITHRADSVRGEQVNITPTSSSSSTRDIELKVNMLALPALVANAGIEIQPLAHWSVSLPVYYTFLNWFSQTVKFRGPIPERALSLC